MPHYLMHIYVTGLRKINSVSPGHVALFLKDVIFKCIVVITYIRISNILPLGEWLRTTDDKSPLV